MNYLSVVLNKVPAGCRSAGLIINHLMYADDLVVFAPSAKGLQKLLDVCIDYGQNHDIIYNSLKSNLMLLRLRLKFYNGVFGCHGNTCYGVFFIHDK